MAVKDRYMPIACGHCMLWEGTSVAFEDKLMISYPTRWGEHRWVSEGKQRVVAEVPRGSSGGSHHANSKLAGTAGLVLSSMSTQQIKQDVLRQRGKLHQLNAIF